MYKLRKIISHRLSQYISLEMAMIIINFEK